MTVRSAAIAFVLALGHQVVSADHAGYVTATGVRVPGATVTATQGERRFVTTTGLEGTYLLDLSDGTWTIRVEMPGFAPQVREIAVRSGAPTVAWQLELLSFESIMRGVAEPDAAANPVAAASTPAARTVTAPSSTPDPGHVAGAPPETVIGSGFGATDGFLINGSVNVRGSSPVRDQSDAFGNNRPARAGSRYHLSASLGMRSSAWDASPRSFHGPSPLESDYRNVDFAGMFGGPLRIPWLRQSVPLMLSYQRYTSQNAPTSIAVMPTALERAGDFSKTRDAFGNPVHVSDPATGLAFPDDVIPQNRISPQATALLRYYPLPNLERGGPNYERAIATRTVRDDLWAAVNDYPISAADRLSFDVKYHRSAAQTSSLFGFDDQSRDFDLNAAVGLTRRFKASLVRFRQTFVRQRATTTPYFANRTNVSAEAGIKGNDQQPLNWGPPALGFSSVASLAAGDYASTLHRINMSLIEASLTRGRHSFAAGGDVRHSGIDRRAQPNARGNFFFGGGLTGSDFADFLLGVPTTSQVAFGDAERNFRGLSFAAFVSDDYRVGPSLSLKVGLRLEYEPPFTETHGRLANLDAASGFRAVRPVVASDRIGPLTGRSYPASLLEPDAHGVHPRVAVAWRPILGSSVLVRGGYGLYRSSGQYLPLAQALSQQSPFVHVVNGVHSADTPLTLATGFITPPATTLATYAVDPDFRASYAHVWQVSVQRDLPAALTVFATYTGTRGKHLLQQILPNTYAPGTDNPCSACPIGFAYISSNGSSVRHAALIQLRRRLRNGLAFSAQYSLAKATDDAATLSGLTGSTSAQNWLDLDAERAPSNDDRRHQLGAQVQYTTRVNANGADRRNRVMAALFGDWVITSRVLIGSGSPLTLHYRSALPGTATQGTLRPSLSGAPVGDIPAGHYLNPLAYTIPAAGRWGDARRNSIRGPWQFSLDGGLTRSFAVTERCSVEWRLDVTNILNRVTYNGVNTTLNSPQFGLPTRINDMRKLHTNLGLRVRF